MRRPDGALMNSDHKKSIGRWGENLAAAFLERQGCAIVARNFATAQGEIDLIAKQGDELLFVEVKTRTSRDYGYPEQAVNEKKIDHLLKAAARYRQRHDFRGFWRLDVVALEINSRTRQVRVKWFKNLGEYN